MTTLDSGDTVTLLPEPILSPAEQQAATEAEAEAEAGLASRPSPELRPKTSGGTSKLGG